MKIGYMGSPEISSRLLRAVSAEHEVVFVVSNPDKARGRKGELQPTAVSSVALEKNLNLYRPVSLKDDSFVQSLKGHGADIFLVFAYGRILPDSILNIPPDGCFNLHASILPLLRGASPIQSALLSGFTETGWTLQKMVQELDAGDVLGNAIVPVDPDDRSHELTEKLMPPGIQLVQSVLENLPQFMANAKPQDASRATFCKKITRENARVSWSNPGDHIHNQVRAYYPSPGSWTALGAKTFRILRTRMPMEMTLKELLPGEIWLSDGRMFVGSGSVPIEVMEIQAEGKKPLAVKEFLKGFRLEEKARFE